MFPEDRNNIGPRVGIAWEPFGSGRGVIRVAYGVYYGSLPGATIWSALVNTALASSTTHVRSVPTTVTNCPQVANQGFGYVCEYVSAPPAAVSQTTSAMVFDRRFRLPMVQQGSFGVDREVGSGVLASATCLFNLDRQLSGFRNLNIAPSTVTKNFPVAGGGGAPGVLDGNVFTSGLYVASECELWPGDGHRFERQCELQRFVARGSPEEPWRT